MILFRLTEDPIVHETPDAPTAGATATFHGKVRNHNDGKNVLRLEYQAFSSMAETEGHAVCQEAADHFGLTHAQAVHRTGILEIGETALLVAVAAPHREAAFAGCQWIVEEIKRRLPVWKKEHYETGPSEWLGCQPVPTQDNAQYATQMALPQIGTGGQERLKASSVLVVGVGGLGSAALPLIAGAGIGTIGIAEEDTVGLTNLPRQTLYTKSQVGWPKSLVAAIHAQRQNPQAVVRTHPFLTPENAKEIVGGYDLVVDGSDNFATKFLLNETCVQLRVPLVQASLYRFEGHLTVVAPASGAGCLRCMWPNQPVDGCVEDCGDGAVFGPTATVLGALQAGEAVKALLGIPSPAQKSLVMVDLLGLGTRHIERQADPACPVCGSGPREPSLYIGPDLVMDSCDLVIDISLDVRQIPGLTSVPWSLGIEEIESVARMAERTGIVCEHGFRAASVARNLRAKGLQCFAVIGGRRGFKVDA